MGSRQDLTQEILVCQLWIRPYTAGCFLFLSPILYAVVVIRFTFMLFCFRSPIGDTSQTLVFKPLTILLFVIVDYMIHEVVLVYRKVKQRRQQTKKH